MANFTVKKMLTFQATYETKLFFIVKIANTQCVCLEKIVVKFSFLHTWGMHSANEMTHAIPIIMFDLLGVQVQLDKGWQMAYGENVKKVVGFFIFFPAFFEEKEGS